MVGYVCVRPEERVSLVLGKPCEATTVISRGNDPRTPEVNLVGGHTSGTFYIRARLRAGACVPADNETLGP